MLRVHIALLSRTYVVPTSADSKTVSLNRRIEVYGKHPEEELQLILPFAFVFPLKVNGCRARRYCTV